MFCRPRRGLAFAGDVLNPSAPIVRAELSAPEILAPAGVPSGPFGTAWDSPWPFGALGICRGSACRAGRRSFFAGAGWRLLVASAGVVYLYIGLTLPCSVCTIPRGGAFVNRFLCSFFQNGEIAKIRLYILNKPPKSADWIFQPWIYFVAFPPKVYSRKGPAVFRSGAPRRR